MPLDLPENSIDIRHLQTVLSRDHNEVDRSVDALDSTPIRNSKSIPLVPATPSRPPKESPHTTTSHAATDATSHDRTGSLHLHYTYSQIDIGETQVDPDSLQDHVPGTAPPVAPQTYDDCETAQGLNAVVNAEAAEPVANSGLINRTLAKDPLQGTEDDEDDIFKSPEDETQITLFPEANRFGTPKNMRSSPSQAQVHNPLAHLNLGGGSTAKPFSLTQAFNAPSSPLERPINGGSSEPPPTPSIHAARIMAKSITGPATIFEEQSSPAVYKTLVVPDRRFSTVSRPSDCSDSSPRARSLSPTLFSSPPPLRSQILDGVSESEDEFEKAQKKKRRVAARKKEGLQQLARASNGVTRRKSDRQLNHFPTIQEMNRWEGEIAGEEPEQTKMGSGRASSAPEPMLKSRSLRVELTSAGEIVTDCSPTQETIATLIPASDPLQRPPREANMQTQPAPVNSQPAGDQLHDIPKSRRIRRTKSAIFPNRKMSSQDPKLQHRSTLPIAQSERVNTEKNSPEPIITSLKNMVPFNIPPTPPGRDAEPPLPMGAPDFVRESSGLLPPTQLVPPSTVTPEPSSSPTNDRQRRISDSTLAEASRPIDPVTPYPQRITPLIKLRNGATTIPESSPYQRHDVLSPAPITEAPKSAPGRPSNSVPGQTTSRGSPTRKRKRAAPVSGEAVVGRGTLLQDEISQDQSNGRLRNFDSLENSTPLFSSQEEPDSIDMLGIVREVGAGYQPEMVLDLPTHEPSRSKRQRPSPPKQSSPPFSSPAPPSSAPTRARLTRRKSTDVKLRSNGKERGKTTTPVPLSTKTLARKASKQKIRNGRVRTSILQETTPTVTDASSPFPGGRDFDDDCDGSSDILATTNPSFHVTRTMRNNLSVPNRVFALFKDSKMLYHPATMTSNDTRAEVRVVFDDGTQDTLERHQVRSLDLRIGDVIRVDIDGMRKSAWVINSFPKPPQFDPSSEASKLTDSHGHLAALVAPKSATSTQSADPVEVPITRIYLAKSLWQPYASRDMISTTMSICVPIHRTESPSLLTTPTTTASTRRTSTPFLTPFPPPTSGGIFANMYFALSFDPSSETLKNTIINKLTTHGSRLLSNGFHDLFSSSTSSPLKLSPAYVSAGFTALITDHHTRKPKFLQALALGIPCLAARWVDDCIRMRKLQDWRFYLLPAGESSYLHGAVRSRVLEPYDAADARLCQVLDSRNKLMDGWSVDFRAKMERERREAFLFLLRAMGAAKVGVGQSKEVWDAVVVGSGEGGGAGRRGTRVMEKEEVVQSLILGRIVE